MFNSTLPYGGDMITMILFVDRITWTPTYYHIYPSPDGHVADSQVWFDTFVTVNEPFPDILFEVPAMCMNQTQANHPKITL